LKIKTIINFFKNILELGKSESLSKEKFFNLSKENKDKAIQELNPYNKHEWGIFKEVEKKFILEYGNHEAIGEVFCGLYSGVGTFNCLYVHIKKGKRKIKLPKQYHGFHIIKEYESKKRKKN